MRILIPSLIMATAIGIGCKNSAAQTESLPNEIPPIVAGGGVTPSALPPIEIGNLTTGGTGCRITTAAGLPTLTDTEISFPVETLVAKDSTPGIKRGACAVALPVSIPAGYRMVVSDVAIDTDILLAGGASAEGSVEVFVAGTLGDTLDISAKSRVLPKHVRQNLSLDPQLTTTCGAAINLRSNSSVVLKDGNGNSSAKLSAIKMTYHLETCP